MQPRSFWWNFEVLLSEIGKVDYQAQKFRCFMSGRWYRLCYDCCGFQDLLCFSKIFVSTHCVIVLGGSKMSICQSAWVGQFWVESNNARFDPWVQRCLMKLLVLVAAWHSAIGVEVPGSLQGAIFFTGFPAGDLVRLEGCGNDGCSRPVVIAKGLASYGGLLPWNRSLLVALKTRYVVQIDPWCQDSSCPMNAACGCGTRPGPRRSWILWFGRPCLVPSLALHCLRRSSWSQRCFEVHQLLTRRWLHTKLLTGGWRLGARQRATATVWLCGRRYMRRWPCAHHRQQQLQGASDSSWMHKCAVWCGNFCEWLEVAPRHCCCRRSEARACHAGRRYRVVLARRNRKARQF